MIVDLRDMSVKQGHNLIFVIAPVTRSTAARGLVVLLAAGKAREDLVQNQVTDEGVMDRNAIHVRVSIE